MQKARKKTAIITLRIEPRFKKMLVEKAQDARMTLTDYLCICGLEKQIVRVDGFDPVLAELKAQGRNLNQLTTLAHMGRIKSLRGDELVEGYAKLCRQVVELTKMVK